jgi:hypothetical protein
MKNDVFWARSEDIGSRFNLFPLQLLVRSDPPPAHFLCNFQNLISPQLVKLIYGKWIKLIAFTNIFKFYELLFYTIPSFFKINQNLGNPLWISKNSLENMIANCDEIQFFPQFNGQFFNILFNLRKTRDCIKKVIHRIWRY